jgi:hypothetical protein
MTEERQETEAQALAQFYAEIRIVLVSTDLSPCSEQIADVYIFDHKVDGEPVDLRIGVVPPGDVGRVALPPDWNWRESQEIYSESA